MKYVHTNIIAKNWKNLSQFYQKVFGCIPVPPERDLKGEWLDKLTGIKDAHIRGEHLCMPGYGNNLPTLEIFSYENNIENDSKVNSLGLSHIAFEVDDVYEALTRLRHEGGTIVGEIVSKKYDGIGTATFVYARDIEGNIIEIQSWEK